MYSQSSGCTNRNQINNTHFFLGNYVNKCFDGAEVCEFVGLYLLNKIKPLLDSNNVGLYRDDGLAIVHKANGPKVDRLRKDIISLFKDEGLSITIDTNLIETDFLDVSFNLNTGKYFSFKKLNHTPPYEHSKPNHTIYHQAIAVNDQQTYDHQAYPVTKLSLTKLRLRAKVHLKILDTKQH